MEINFPSENLEPTVQDPRKFLLVAQSKAGKTSLIQKLPNCLTIDLNDSAEFYGGKFINVRKVKDQLQKEVGEEKQISLLHAYRVVVKKLRDAINAGTVSYDYIALDTTTDLEELAKDLALIRYKKAPMGRSFKGDDIYTLERGAGYGWVRSAFMDLYSMLNGCYNKGLILVAHVKDSSVVKNGKEINVTDVNLTGKLKLIIPADMDAIGFMHRDKNGVDNILSFKSDERRLSVGSRCRHLQNEEFVISTLKEDGNLETFWEKVYLTLNK